MKYDPKPVKVLRHETGEGNAPRAAEAGEDWKVLMVEARNRLSRLWEFLPSEGAFGPVAQLIGRIDAYLAASPLSSRPAIIEARIDRGDAVNLAMDWLENRPTLTPNGIQALCNAVMLMDKTLSSRPAIIEECARVCDEQYEKHKHYFSVGPGLATACATAIRALAPGGQNADQCELSECLHRLCRCGHAECHHADENVQPNCSECQCNGFRELAPAEVAEGAVAWIEHHKAGDNLNWDRVDHPYAKATPLYRAAPSLSREEWAILGHALDCIDEGHEALRAKVREAGK
jgi:hypothetical protein